MPRANMHFSFSSFGGFHGICLFGSGFLRKWKLWALYVFFFCNLRPFPREYGRPSKTASSFPAHLQNCGQLHSSPELAPLFSCFFAFLGSPLFPTNQAKKIKPFFAGVLIPLIESVQIWWALRGLFRSRRLSPPPASDSCGPRRVVGTCGVCGFVGTQ